MAATDTTGRCMVRPVQWPDALNSEGLTQIELAQRLGVSQSLISAWVTLARFPSGSTISALARKLAVDENELLIAVHEAKRRPKPDRNAVAALAARMAALEGRFDELHDEVRGLLATQDTSDRDHRA